MMHNFRKFSQLLTITVFVAICFTQAPVAEQPANLGDLKKELTLYVEGGAYEADLFAALQPAIVWLEQRVAAAEPGERLAVVLDIDDTSLSSLPAIEANDYAFFPVGSCDLLPEGPCAWSGWVEAAAAPAMEPTLALYRRARELGVAVLFVTGRKESGRAATEANLRAVGFDGWDGLSLKPEDLRVDSAADYKAPVRAAYEEAGWTIILNVGDQASDLAGGHAERTVLLPNPFYRLP